MGSSQINVGPLNVEMRDNLAAFRDERDLPNYNEALKALPIAVRRIRSATDRHDCDES